MSDIEDELLLLAGGEDSSDGEEETYRRGSPEPSRSQPRQSPEASESGPSKNVTTKKPVQKKGKQSSRNDDESEEEGEASSAPGSPDSQQSAPMDESDSDSDAPPAKPQSSDDDLNKYAVDGMFIDQAEKARIMSMVEIDRETILAERREEIEKIKQGKLLRQLVQNKLKDEKKRKASVANLEEDEPRKTSRIRTKIGGTKVGETSSGMDSLRRAREERHVRKQQWERDNDRRKQRSPEYRAGDNRDGRGNSEDEWDGPSQTRPKSRSPDNREKILPADLRDVNHVSVTRNNLAKFCFYPGFEDATTGCFVRVNVGDGHNPTPVYRIGIIRGFTTGRPYAVVDNNGRSIIVDLYVKSAIGKENATWPFLAVSNSPVTEAEWIRYQKTCHADGVSIPKKQALINKVDDINKLYYHPFTELELVAKLKRQNDLKAKYGGVHREQIKSDIAAALANGNSEKAAKLQEELDNLETPRLAFRTGAALAERKENRSPSQQDILAELNARNRAKTAEAVRRAELKERHRQMELEKKALRGEDVDEEDRSRRLRTRAKFIHDEGEAERLKEEAAKKAAKKAAGASGASTPAGAPGTPKVLPHIAKLQEQQRKAVKGGMPMIHKPLHDDDIIGALDLELDIEI